MFDDGSAVITPPADATTVARAVARTVRTARSRTLPTIAASSSAMSPRRTLLDRVAELSDDDLATESTRIAAAVSAAQAELAVVLSEIERREVHRTWDCPSIERFAGWKCQLSASRAAALGTLGRAIDELPSLGEAVIDGRLSVDKAVAIARVASPVSEAALVDLAQQSTVEQTQRFCAKWRRVGDERSGLAPDGVDPLDDDARARARDEAALGRVIVYRDEDGIELRARFDHVHGELVLRALDAVTAQVRAERRDAVPVDGRRARERMSTRGPAGRVGGGALPASVDEIPLESLDSTQWRAQGLLRMCETASIDAPTTIHRGGFRSEVVVHVPVDALLDPTDIDDLPRDDPALPSIETSSIVQIPTLEPRGIRLRRDAARLLACDAGLHVVTEDPNGDPLHMGRRTTSISAAQRRAVHARDPHCTWPGCTATTVELHHRHHRVAGGHDDIENLVPLCLWHHGAVHRRSIVVGRSSDGVLHFVRTDGTRIQSAAPFVRRDADDGRGPPPPPVAPGTTIDALRARQRALGIDVDSPLRDPQWMNDRFDLSDVIAAIADRRDAALRRTRPTGPASTTQPGADVLAGR